MKNRHLEPVVQTLYDHYDNRTWDTIGSQEMLRLMKEFFAVRQKGLISIYASIPSPFGDRLREFCLLDPEYYKEVRQVIFSHNTKREGMFEKYAVTLEWLWVAGEDYLRATRKDLDFANKENI